MISALPVAAVCWILERVLWKRVQQQPVCRAWALWALLPVPPVAAPVPWVTHQHEGQKQDMIPDGATGTRYSPAELTGRGCFTAKHKPHCFSGAPHLSKSERTKSPSQRAQAPGWEEQSPRSITYLLISILYLAPRYCSYWSPINTNDR